jgi:hypothetical protein
MKKTIFAALGLIGLAVSANAQNPADNPSIERRAVEAVPWGMPGQQLVVITQEQELVDGDLDLVTRSLKRRVMSLISGISIGAI